MNRFRGSTAARGMVALGLVGALTAGALLSPVGAAFNPTKKKVKKISTKQATKVVKKNVVVSGNAAGANQAIDNFTSGAFTSILAASITAPGNGYLYIVGTISAEDDGNIGGDGGLNYRLRLDGTPLDTAIDSNDLDYDIFASADGAASGATSAVVPVTKGAHTVHLEAAEFGTGSYIEGRSVSLLFTPSGTGITVPLRGSPGASGGVNAE